MNKRVESLDYLRGLMAVAVMLYHYASDAAVAGGILGKLGIYAVATFYVLSGVSLGMVYRDRLNTGRDALAFMTKRVFRIAPLFWLATSAALLLGMATGSPLRIGLNYSLAFGFLAPNDALAQGAWSIGNEMVFYALLPLLIRVPRRAFVVGLALAAWYAFGRLSPDAGLQGQWRVYVQPLNHLFLFTGGVAIVSLPRMRRPALAGLLAAAVFCAYPMAAQIDIVTGWSRFVMSGCALLAVLSVYQANPTFRSIPAKALAFLGEGCYSIYLLHPIVFRVVGTVGASGWVRFAVSVFVTLGLSYLTFRRIEKPMMDIGARVARRIAAPLSCQETAQTAG